MFLGKVIQHEHYAHLSTRVFIFTIPFNSNVGFGEPIAMEGALKLKEIGYLHAEGYSGGALKHGPFAMIESDENGKQGATPIVSILFGDIELLVTEQVSNRSSCLT